MIINKTTTYNLELDEEYLIDIIQFIRCAVDALHDPNNPWNKGLSVNLGELILADLTSAVPGR